MATDLKDLIYGNNNKVNNYDCSYFCSGTLLSVEQYHKYLKSDRFLVDAGLEEEEEGEKPEEAQPELTNHEKGQEN